MKLKDILLANWEDETLEQIKNDLNPNKTVIPLVVPKDKLEKAKLLFGNDETEAIKTLKQLLMDSINEMDE